MVILDTNIIIDHLRTNKVSESYLIQLVKKMSLNSISISIITIQELYQGQSSRTKDAEQKFLSVILPFQILPYTYGTAQLAGKLIRDGVVSSFADAAIAASTILNDGQLFTLNQKDFEDVKDLSLFSL